MPQQEDGQHGPSCGATTWHTISHPAPLCLELHEAGTWRWGLSPLSEQRVAIEHVDQHSLVGNAGAATQYTPEIHKSPSKIPVPIPGKEGTLMQYSYFIAGSCSMTLAITSRNPAACPDQQTSGWFCPCPCSTQTGSR